VASETKPNADGEFKRTLGPFVGVHDSPDPGASKPTKLLDLVNMVVPDVENGSPALQRHGMLGLAQRLTGIGQGLFQHRHLDGSVHRLVFCGGRMLLWDGADTFTDISPDGIAISSYNPVFASNLLGKLLVSDEVNPPWVQDPVAGTTTTIDFDGAGTPWATKGGLTVRSAKAVAIIRAIGADKITDESTFDLEDESGVNITTELVTGLQGSIAWSEEGDPTTGWQQTDFDDTLQLAQASSEVLGGVVGTEDSIVYLRNQGIGNILGEIGPNFSTANTRDTISTTSGTDAPAAMVLNEQYLWYLDMDGRVMRIPLSGGAPQTIWPPMRLELELRLGSAATRANVVQFARGAYHEEYKIILFTIWDDQTLYAFHAESATFLGAWPVGGPSGSSIHIRAMGSMVDINNRPTFIILGSVDSTDDQSQTVFWRQKHPDDVNQWLDQPDASVASYLALDRALETHLITSNAATSFRARKVFSQLPGDTARHTVGMSYVTPSGGRSATRTASTTAVQPGASGRPGIASARWSTGPNAQGTALSIRLSCSNTDNVRWGVHDITIDAQVLEARINAR
jgi:hypothetical protein